MRGVGLGIMADWEYLMLAAQWIPEWSAWSTVADYSEVLALRREEGRAFCDLYRAAMVSWC